MTEVDLPHLQHVLDLEHDGRIPHNITKTHVHVGSYLKLDEDEIMTVVGIAEQLTDMQDPQFFTDAWQISTEYPNNFFIEMEKTDMVFKQVAENMLKANLKKLCITFDGRQRIHAFLLDVTMSASTQALMELGIIEPDEQFETPFERHHGYYVVPKPYGQLQDEDIKQIKGVCISPQLGRKWIDAFKAGYQLAQGN